jgi:hypothetical protein
VIDPGPGRKVVGDVLAGTLGGKRGFLFWTGAKYRWLEQEGMPAGPSSLTR